MNYRIIPVTAFSQNCSLIWCEQTKLAALVDPGGDAEKIKQEVADSGVTLMQILLTHGHLDHVGAAAELAEHYGVPIVGPEKEDEFWLQGLPAQSRMFGLEECQPLTPDRWLNEGDTKLLLKKLAPTRLVTNSFRDRVEAAEGRGASAEELRELLGRGRAKKGIFEGDLEEGELEIGQVAALFRRRQSVDEVMKELLEGYRRASDKIRSAGL